MDLLPVNLEQFWEDDELSHRENCFSMRSSQVMIS